jgi:hypothetical protein
MRQMAHGVVGRVWPAGVRYSAVCVVRCPIAWHRVHRGRMAIGRCGIARAGVPGFALMSDRHVSLAVGFMVLDVGNIAI